MPIGQNKHITAKQNRERHTDPYSIVRGHHSLVTAQKGVLPVVAVWFLSIVSYLLSPLCLKNKVEGHFWFLGNLQNHELHLQKYVCLTYNITSVGSHNHTILNF